MIKQYTVIDVIGWLRKGLKESDLESVKEELVTPDLTVIGYVKTLIRKEYVFSKIIDGEKTYFVRDM